MPDLVMYKGGAKSWPVMAISPKHTADSRPRVCTATPSQADLEATSVTDRGLGQNQRASREILSPAFLRDPTLGPPARARVTGATPHVGDQKHTDAGAPGQPTNRVSMSPVTDTASFWVRMSLGPPRVPVFPLCSLASL